MSAQHPFHPALDTRDPRGDARRVRLSPWAAPGGRGEAAPPPGARLSIRPVRKLRRAAASISLAGAKPAEFARPAGYLLFLPLPAVLFFSSSLFFFFFGRGSRGYCFALRGVDAYGPVLGETAPGASTKTPTQTKRPLG